MPVAQADSHGAFISLSAGQSSFSSSAMLSPRPSFVGDAPTTDDLRDNAFGLLAGYRWSVTSSLNLGVEAGYSDLGEATSRTDNVDRSVGLTITSRTDRYERARGALLGVNAKWDLPGNWTATAHAGMARYHTHFELSDVATFEGEFVDTPTGTLESKYHEGKSISNNDYYYGVGVGYDVTSHLGLTLTFDEFRPEFRDGPALFGSMYTDHLKVWGLRAEYRF
jgi:opacity protein-like surface antigen